MKNLRLFKPAITFSIVTLGWVTWGVTRCAAADDLPPHGEELVEAAREGKYSAVAEILQTNPGCVNAQLPQPYKGTESRYSRWSALHWGVERDDRSIVEVLLAHGANPDIKSERGMLPLLLVKSREVAAKLIEAGADVNAVGEYDCMPIDCAKTAAIAELLIEHGVRIEGRALLSAVHGNRTAVAQLLIERGAAVEQSGWSGKTPLFYACINGNLLLAELLIAKGADIHAKNRDGDAPIWLTAGDLFHYQEILETDHVEVMRLLVKHGASLQVTSQRKETLLHQAAMNGYLEVARYLIDSGLDVNARDESGCTPLHWAARILRGGFNFCSDGSREIALVQLLIERGADVNVQSIVNQEELDAAGADSPPKGLTPLAMASVEDSDADLAFRQTETGTPQANESYAAALRSIETSNRSR